MGAPSTWRGVTRAVSKLFDEHEVCADAHGLGLVRLAEHVRVNHAQKYLRALDYARAGAAEVTRRVDGPDLPVTHGREFVPAARQTRARERAQRVLFVEAAGREHDDFGRVLSNLFRGRDV